MVVLSSFVVAVLVDGVCFSAGIFFNPFRDYFHASKAQTAWVGSVLNGSYMIVGPLVSACTNRWGCCRVAMLGSLFAGISFFLSTFSTTLSALIVTYGMLGGIGFGFVYLPANIMPAYYFAKKRALATGIACCGSGVGAFIFAPLCNFLLEEYGWKGATWILSGLVLNGLVFSMLYRPLKQRKRCDQSLEEAKVEEEEKGGGGREGGEGERESDDVSRPGRRSRLHQMVVGPLLAVVDVSLLKSPTFVIYGLSCILSMLGFFVPFVYLPPLSEDLGVSATKASLLISIIGIANTVSRVGVGFVADRPWADCLLINNVALIVGGVATCCVPFLTEYWLLAAYSFIFGSSIEVDPTCLLPSITGFNPETPNPKGDNLTLQCSVMRSVLPWPTLTFSCRPGDALIVGDNTSTLNLNLDLDVSEFDSGEVTCRCDALWEFPGTDSITSLLLNTSAAFPVGDETEGENSFDTRHLVAAILGGLVGLVLILMLTLWACLCFNTDTNTKDEGHHARTTTATTHVDPDVDDDLPSSLPSADYDVESVSELPSILSWDRRKKATTLPVGVAEFRPDTSAAGADSPLNQRGPTKAAADQQSGHHGGSSDQKEPSDFAAANQQMGHHAGSSNQKEPWDVVNLLGSTVLDHQASGVTTPQRGPTELLTNENEQVGSSAGDDEPVGSSANENEPVNGHTGSSSANQDALSRSSTDSHGQAGASTNEQADPSAEFPDEPRGPNSQVLPAGSEVRDHIVLIHQDEGVPQQSGLEESANSDVIGNASHGETRDALDSVTCEEKGDDGEESSRYVNIEAVGKLESILDVENIYENVSENDEENDKKGHNPGENSTKGSEHLAKSTEHLTNGKEHFANGAAHLVNRIEHPANVAEHLSTETEHLINGTERLPNGAEHLPNDTEHLTNEAEHPTNGTAHFAAAKRPEGEEEESPECQSSGDIALDEEGYIIPVTFSQQDMTSSHVTPSEITPSRQDTAQPHFDPTYLSHIDLAEVQGRCRQDNGGPGSGEEISAAAGTRETTPSETTPLQDTAQPHCDPTYLSPIDLAEVQGRRRQDNGGPGSGEEISGAAGSREMKRAEERRAGLPPRFPRNSGETRYISPDRVRKVGGFPGFGVLRHTVYTGAE